MLGIPRTVSETGRGGQKLSTWRANEATDAVVGAFNSASERIEGITKRLNGMLGMGVAVG